MELYNANLPAKTGEKKATPAPRPVLAAGGSMNAIVPQDIEQAFRLATIMHASQMFKFKSAEQILIAVMHGMEIGLPPMQAATQIAVINGKPSVFGDAALALVSSSGLLEDIEEVFEGDGDSMVAVCTVKRRYRPSPIVSRFSVVDAKKAKLWGKSGPWTDYPKRMLQMRARGFALRDAFPDVLGGVGISEEVHDYDSEPENPAASQGGSARVTLADMRGPVNPQPSQQSADDPVVIDQTVTVDMVEESAEPAEAAGQLDLAPAEPTRRRRDMSGHKAHVATPFENNDLGWDAYALAIDAVAEQFKTPVEARVFLDANPALEKAAFDDSISAEDRAALSEIRNRMKALADKAGA